VFLELEPDDFFSYWDNLILLSAQARNITSVGFDSLIIQRKSAHKYRQLQHKVSNDAQTSDQAEVLQCWHISQHSNEEGQRLTSCSSEDGGTDFLQGKCDSGLD
jgi:hypothetical protein